MSTSSDMNYKKMENFFKRIAMMFVKAKNGRHEFWDIVVLTASDQHQAEAYEMQLTTKTFSATVPAGCKYVVYADPPNNKAGSGGSTFHVLECLKRDFGVEALEKKRVLLLSAGGYSQRLISASALGKLFTSIPLPGNKANSAVMQVFELKLMLYLPLLKNMPPGIFLSSSDTIELYSLDDDSVVNFSNGGFTALAHPSSIEVGLGHGVFVLDQSNSTDEHLMAEVSRVLQKPTEKQMLSENCIYSGSSTEEEEGGEMEVDATDFVYTDSCYFFDAEISKKLLKFYEEQKPLSCEVCAYGDFMRPLGSNPIRDYTEGDGELSRVRSLLYNLLQGTPLSIIKMNNSVFYHLGTMSEYIEHMTHKSSLSKILNFTGSVFNTGLPSGGEDEGGLTGTQMHCWVDSTLNLGKDCVLEYCQIEGKVDIGDRCIVSNCVLKTGTHVPSDTFIHTLAVHPEMLGCDRMIKEVYVCILLDTRDDIKACVEHTADLVWCNEKISDRFDDVTRIFAPDCSQRNLWNARLFTVHDTMGHALKQSLYLRNNPGNARDKGDLYVSIGEVIRAKNAKFMLDYRRLLNRVILCSINEADALTTSTSTTTD